MDTGTSFSSTGIFEERRGGLDGKQGGASLELQDPMMLVPVSLEVDKDFKEELEEAHLSSPVDESGMEASEDGAQQAKLFPSCCHPEGW